VRGYATRDRSFAWAFYDGLNVVPSDDGLAAIALPLFDGKRAHGSICILWIRTAFTVEQFAAEHLTNLQDAAREIVSSLQQRAK
jgi:IclR family mhp operon transcriptional activator